MEEVEYKNKCKINLLIGPGIKKKKKRRLIIPHTFNFIFNRSFFYSIFIKIHRPENYHGVV